MISHAIGPVKKRFTSPVIGSPHSIWLFPCPAKSPWLE
ncbi:Uncharacterised protein [Vibrio cholerae]|nr:Uncharacterised protein [Vibrio cholerae]